MPLISIRAYARLRGLKSDNSVRKAIATGKIPLVNGMIDPAIADAAWERNRDAGQESKLAEAVSAAAEKPVQTGSPVQQPLIDLESAPPAKEPQPEAAVAPLTAARIWSTEESATIKQITRRKMQADLLEKEEVDRNWAFVLQTVKDRLRLIPDKVGPKVAMSTDEAECRSIVMKEIMDALACISKSIEESAAA